MEAILVAEVAVTVTVAVTAVMPTFTGEEVAGVKDTETLGPS
jgi:hypothetical protein